MENMNKNYSNTTSTFRQNEDGVQVDNFQVENMRQKLKRAKKVNVRKSKNYKKIETFDTLTNDEQPSMGKLVEGFEKKDYEGYDDVDETPSKPINIKIGEHIEYIYNILTSANTYLSTTFTNALSGNLQTLDKTDENDESQDVDKQEEKYDWSILDLSGGLQTPDISNMKSYISTFDLSNVRQTPDAIEIKDYLITLESVLVASYIVYNWYFLMYYAKDNAIDIQQISLADLKSSNNSFIKFFLFLFEYAVLIVVILNNILLNYIPKYIGYYMNGSTRLTLLFIFIIYCVKHFGFSFKTFLVNSLEFKTEGSIASLLMIFVILAFFYTLVDDSIQSTIDPTRSKPMVMRVFEKGMIASPFAIVGLLFYYIIRLLLIIFITLPAGCILTAMYLLFYSFFGRIYYAENTTYDDLNNHANGESPIKFDDCDDGLITRWIKIIMYYIFLFFDSIKSNSFLLVLLVIVSSMSSSLYSNLSNAKSFIPGILFRDIIGMYNGIAIAVIIAIIYAKFFNNFTKE